MKKRFTLVFFLCLIALYAYPQSETPPEEYTYDEGNNLKIYCIKPADFDPNKSYPAILIFHGGGWSIGEASWGFGSARHYASKGMVAFSVQYRLQDSTTIITPYESVLDAQSSIRWVRQHAEKFAVNPDKIAAYGWSAGAHLAACAAVFENLHRPDEKISSAPNLLALKSPALSLMLYPNFQTRLGDKIEVEKISPAEHVSKETPASIIVIGKTDTVTPIEGAELYHKNMLAKGNDSELHIYEGVGHLFTPSSEPDDDWPNPDKKIVQEAQNAIDAFLQKHGYIR
ncbi:MAG: alpha/beta hydrolase [Bacteroidota bacterium]